MTGDYLYQLATKDLICLTAFGFDFVTACRPPGSVAAAQE
jgi:hypothetical protein